jgi:alpha-tubulin suppressor-like RCC1 family protein
MTRHDPHTCGATASLVLALMLAACDSSSGPSALAANMQIVAGNAQSGEVGQELPDPLVVRVTDDNDQPVKGQLVNFRVTDGGGSVFAGSALTNQDGEARERWTLGEEPGVPQTVEARAVDQSTGDPLVFATFTAEALAPSSGAVFSTVSAGFGSCGLTATGQAYCWGGLLRVPGPVPGGQAFVRISTGGGSGPDGLHTCALTAAGAAFCWGRNDYGQLGIGTQTAVETPTAVAGGLTFTDIYAGDRHTCALTAAHQAYCWGLNGFPSSEDGGQLGDGTRTSRSVPTAVSGGLAFDSLSLGAQFTCGLSGGAAYCWGENDYGNLGNGGQGTGMSALVPTAVAGGLTFASITAGNVHACALTPTGAAYCWGKNWGDALGTGTPDDSPVPVPVAGGLSFGTIGAGSSYTCALAIDGTPFCWGWDDSVVMSKDYNNGTSVHSSTPVAVPGGLHLTSLSVGDYHSCGVTTGPVAYCWFSNLDGQLGNGTFTAGTYTPTAVR